MRREDEEQGRLRGAERGYVPLCCHERLGGVSGWREGEKEKGNEWNAADLDRWALW